MAAFAGPAAALDREGWAFSAGGYDIIDEEGAFEAGVEYRFPSFRIKKIPFVPSLGVSGNSDGSAWAVAAIRYDWEIGGHWILTPHLGVSVYEEGDGKDLGGAVEFRSGLELAYRLRSGSRVGLCFYHLSNSRLYRLNPGSESVVVTWSLGR